MCCFFMGNAFWNKIRFVIPSILLSNALDYKRHWYHNSILGEMAIHSNAVPSFYKCICISNTFWIRFFLATVYLKGNIKALKPTVDDLVDAQNTLCLCIFFSPPPKLSSRTKSKEGWLCPKSKGRHGESWQGLAIPGTAKSREIPGTKC